MCVSRIAVARSHRLALRTHVFEQLHPVAATPQDEVRVLEARHADGVAQVVRELSAPERLFDGLPYPGIQVAATGARAQALRSLRLDMFQLRKLPPRLFAHGSRAVGARRVAPVAV